MSAFLRQEGVRADLLRHAAGGAFALSLSQAIVTETETVLLEREHIRRRYPYSNDDVAAFCQTLPTDLFLLSPIFPHSEALTVIPTMIWCLRPHAPPTRHTS